MNYYHTKQPLIDSFKGKSYDNYLLLDFLDKQNNHKFTSTIKNKKIMSSVEKLAVNGSYCVFEIVQPDIKRKPYLDLEHIYPDLKSMKKDYTTVIDGLINDIIYVFKNSYNIVLKRNEILLLDSSGKVTNGYKMSLHVIVASKKNGYYFTNSKNTTSSTYHFYTALINHNAMYNDYLDSQVYNKSVNFRIIESAKKHTDKRILYPVNNTTYEKIELNDTDKLNYFLSYFDPKCKMISLATPLVEQCARNKKYISKNKPTKTNYNPYLLKFVQQHHPSAYSTNSTKNYNFNYSDRKEPCPLTGNIHTGSNGFYVYESNTGYYMRCHSAKCKNKIKHIGYINECDEFFDNATKVNTKYLSTDKSVIEAVDRFATTNKVLAIKSHMSTGKTVLVKKIIEKFEDLDMNKMIWITHRQTFTNFCDGEFKKYGFINYLNVEGSLYDYDKVIIQIDSFMRLTQDYTFDHSHLFKKYDLIIIDEAEGNLNHYSSPFLNKLGHDSRDLFNYFKTVVDYSSKLLLLDADMNSRSKLLVESYKDKGTEVIYNSYVSMQRNIKITNSESKFLEDFYSDVDKGLTLCMSSMMSTPLEVIYETLISRKVKCVLHTAKTDDSLKKKLKNVNDFWSQFQVVLYSPTIESGISFDKIHFDKIYSIIADGYRTCSQRSYLQQLGRVRHVKDNTIYTLYSNLPVVLSDDKKSLDHVIVDSSVYTYEDVVSYYKEFEDFNGRKMLLNNFTNIEDEKSIKICKTTMELQLYDQICLHNEVEEWNKNHDVFMTVLNCLAKRSNFTLEYDYVLKKDTIKSDKKKTKTAYFEKMADVKVDAYDNVKVKALQKLVQKSSATEIDKIKLDKIFFIKTFRVKNVDNKDVFIKNLKNLYDKKDVLNRYSLLFGYTTLDDNEIDTFRDGKERARIKVVLNLINLILNKKYTELKLEYLNKINLSQKEHDDGLDRITNESLYFKKIEKYHPLFFKSTKNFVKKETVSHKSVKNILIKYNIEFKTTSQIRVGEDRECTYCLSVGKQIKNILLKTNKN